MIEHGGVNEKFVKAHCAFATGPTDIGYGLPADDPLEQGQSMRDKAGAHWTISFDEFKRKLAPYTAAYVSKLSGVSEEQLVALAKLYTDPKRKRVLIGRLVGRRRPVV